MSLKPRETFIGLILTMGRDKLRTNFAHTLSNFKCLKECQNHLDDNSI